MRPIVSPACGVVHPTGVHMSAFMPELHSHCLNLEAVERVKMSKWCGSHIQSKRCWTYLIQQTSMILFGNFSLLLESIRMGLLWSLWPYSLLFSFIFPSQKWKDSVSFLEPNFTPFLGCGLKLFSAVQVHTEGCSHTNRIWSYDT